MLRKPHTAFGRSGEFTPGGSEFDEVTKALTEEDLLVPWLMAHHAVERGYSVRSQKSLAQNDYRNQNAVFLPLSVVQGSEPSVDWNARD